MAKGPVVKKLVSATVLAVMGALLSVFSAATPAHAAFDACAAVLNYDTQVIYKLKNNGDTLSFGNMTVTRTKYYPNRYCVHYSTSNRYVQRIDGRVDLTLRSDGSCPVPGGYGGGGYPSGYSYKKTVIVADNTCSRLYFNIYYGGKYWTASTYRRNLP